MKAATVKNISAWLSENGFDFRVVKMIEGDTAIMVNTDYEGLYPNENTWKQINTIRRRYGKRHQVETRGHYSGVLIRY